MPELISTEELFRRYAPFVARLLYNFGVARADIDDALQEVFLVVHRLGGYVAGPATPTTFLGSIASRAAASVRRRALQMQQRGGDVPPEELADFASNPVRLLERDQELQLVDAALAGLDPALRLVLILVDIEGQSCAAVAASEQVAVGTIYWRLHRGRRKFHDAVERLRSAQAPLRRTAEGRSV